MADAADIRKKGMLVKMKTMKKKLFVLREKSSSGAARLEYYDNEKKLSLGAKPKRSIHIKTCFSINKKSDAKNKYAIALYTKDDCFTLVLDNEDEQRAWLSEMIDLRNQPEGNEGTSAKPLFFEHIWLVTVKPKGLGNGRCINPGQYRLCLTNKTLGLFRLNHEEPDILVQLESIRRCGHSDCFFFMELGRSALTGAGEIWMQVEDTVISQNMHEAILNSMKSNNAAQDPLPNFRPRTRSAVDKANMPAASSAAGTGTLPIRSKTMSVSVGENRQSSPQRKRHSPSPSKPPSNASTSNLRPPYTASLSQGHSPVGSSPLSHTLSHESHRTRTDSMESRGSRGSRCTTSSLSCEEFDLSPIDRLSSGACSTRSVTPEGPIHEEGSSYMSMTPGSRDSTTLTNVSPPVQGPGYMDMSFQSNKSLRNSPALQDSYMDMSPGEHSYLDSSRVSSSASSAVSSTSDGGQDDDGNYFDMAPLAQSLSPVQERFSDAGYIEMSPLAVQMRSGSRNVKPDKVFSYLAEDSMGEFPKRAYSVGSKTAVQNKPLHESYMDMSKGRENVEKINPKSSSAPHLSDKQKSGTLTPRFTSESPGAQSKTDLFMELDFNKDGNTPGGFRPRVSSAGQERMRTGSFGNRDKFKTMMQLRRHEAEQSSSSVASHRPRTATICQDTFRNRTSSFTGSDMRPRSSSHGNSRSRKMQNRNDNSEVHINSSKQTSRESVSSTSSNYMDMTPKMSSSPSTRTDAFRRSATTSRSQESEYMSIGVPKVDEKKTRTPERSVSHSMKKRSNNSGPITVKVSSSFSSSESLHSSSSAQSSDSRGGRIHDSSGGEYIEIDYKHSPQSKQKSVRSSKDRKNGKSDEPYVSYSPAHSRDSSPGRVDVAKGLDKVVSPIRAEQLPPPPSKPPPASPAKDISGSSAENSQKKDSNKPHDYINIDFHSSRRASADLPKLSSSPNGSGRAVDAGYIDMDFTKKVDKKKNADGSAKSDYMGMDFSSKSSSQSQIHVRRTSNCDAPNGDRSSQMAPPSKPAPPSKAAPTPPSKAAPMLAVSQSSTAPLAKSMPPPFKPLPPKPAFEPSEPTKTDTIACETLSSAGNSLSPNPYPKASLEGSSGPNRGSNSSLTDKPLGPLKLLTHSSHGSSSSLNAFDNGNGTGNGKSSPKIHSSDRIGSSNSLSLASGSGCQEDTCSMTSQSSPRGSANLNYACLDLMSSADESGFTCSTSTEKSVLSRVRHPSDEIEDPPLQYAEIDFSKCAESRPKPDLPSALRDSSTFPF